MPKHKLKHDLFLAWLAPVAVAGLLSACGGADKGSDADAGSTAGGAAATGGGAATGGAAATPPAAADTHTTGAVGAAPDTQAAKAEAGDTQASAAAPAKPKAAASGGGGGPGDPKLIALGDSIFHGQAGGGTCYACHGPDGKGSAVGADLTDKEWLHSDGSYEAIVKTIQTGVPKPTKAPAPMPPMGGASLTPEQVKAVAAYVYSLSHGGGKG